MKCDRCKSARIAALSAKTADRLNIALYKPERDHRGYEPQDLGISDMGADYIAFDYCLNCGKIQGEFPLPKTNLERGGK